MRGATRAVAIAAFLAVTGVGCAPETAAPEPGNAVRFSPGVIDAPLPQGVIPVAGCWELLASFDDGGQSAEGLARLARAAGARVDCASFPPGDVVAGGQLLQAIDAAGWPLSLAPSVGGATELLFNADQSRCVIFSIIPPDELDVPLPAAHAGHALAIAVAPPSVICRGALERDE